MLIEKQKLYVGKINSLTWFWIRTNTSQPAFSWLCTGITGNSNGVSGSLYTVTYNFAYREDTWNPKVVFTRIDGNPAPDFAPQQVFIYRTANFNLLEI